MEIGGGGTLGIWVPRLGMGRWGGLGAMYFYHTVYTINAYIRS